ncbi:MAG: hypothetical protein K6U74_02175 [Firmicutes bacterium]|nr:hypothetical protein [Bacillota bacterium]
MAQVTQQRPTVVMVPPAWAVRERAGLAFPWSTQRVGQAVMGTMAGAGASAVFIGALGEPNARFVGALITGALGVYFAAVSPLATIPHEIGLGMACASASHMYYALFKQYA